MSQIAFQDLYADQFSHCFGCGRNHPQGHHLKSYWNEQHNGTIAKITPSAIYTGGVPEHLYGGLIASLLDCHGAASATAFQSQALGIALDGTQNLPRFVTASLTTNFIQPTPTQHEITIIGKLLSIEGRKVNIDLSLFCQEQMCANGQMLAIQLV